MPIAFEQTFRTIFFEFLNLFLAPDRFPTFRANEAVCGKVFVKSHQSGLVVDQNQPLEKTTHRYYSSRQTKPIVFIRTPRICITIFFLSSNKTTACTWYNGSGIL
ncbi:unnamed protein product [Amoebophrya sp. A25]|nr:unnamed protein product [Amoebophrya sp. A25]|eukprot:GSA25T00022520001.1